jgi:sugar transferase (PEP-CTERM/EpsH1 system associated)
VLQFAPRVCWPLDTGAKLRNYHLARVLAEGARVTLLAFSDERQPLAEFESFYERVIAIQREPGYTPSKIVRGAIGRTPLPVLNYTTDAMKQELARVLSEHDFDIVQIESIHLSAYLPIIRSARSHALVICDWHNIESELMQRYSERETSPLRRAYARRTARQMSITENRATKEFDAHIVVSRRDETGLLALNPNARVFVIENGVDTAFYSDERIEQAHTVWLAQTDAALAAGAKDNRRRIVFVGSMDYHANVDAAIDFTRGVWPSVHEPRSELVLTIVGRDPAPEVRRLAAVPGVEVTGRVDDVRPYYREALAAIVPLRVGGGSRLKILEAMASGVPVVSTTLGAEGLDVADGENILIADTTDELSEAIIGVANDELQRKNLGAAGRALVSECYDWTRLGLNLFEIYQRLTVK